MKTCESYFDPLEEKKMFCTKHPRKITEKNL